MKAKSLATDSRSAKAKTPMLGSRPVGALEANQTIYDSLELSVAPKPTKYNSAQSVAEKSITMTYRIGLNTTPLLNRTPSKV